MRFFWPEFRQHFLSACGRWGRYKNPAEREEARKAINEWADGDAVAAHFGYGNDLFSTHDFARDAGETSVFQCTNREAASAVLYPATSQRASPPAYLFRFGLQSLAPFGLRKIKGRFQLISGHVRVTGPRKPGSSWRCTCSDRPETWRGWSWSPSRRLVCSQSWRNRRRC